MASGQKKKTTTKKTAPQKSALPPIRREVSGGVCLLLALCVVVSYFQADAIVLNLLGNLLKGLAGYGYWLAAPALALAGGEPAGPPGASGGAAYGLRPGAAGAAGGHPAPVFV